MESIFATLPASVRHQIDHAFDVTAGENPSLEHTPAGFIIDDAGDQLTGGGFFIDDYQGRDPVPPPRRDKPTHIPLSGIPAALQLLDLQPDDPQILAVFRNAASGWASSGFHLESHHEQRDDLQMVSRDDWRAVCAVLLESIVPQPSEPDDEMDRRDMDVDDEEKEPESGSDEYVYENEPLDDELSAGSDDEYLEGSSRAPAVKSKSPRKRRRSDSSPLASATDGPRQLTSRQSRECRRAFALCFPDIDVDSDELDKKKIMIQDISRVAKLLKEKIQAEEMVEMLDAFSTCNDKSMSLRDFEQMMIAAKMA